MAINYKNVLFDLDGTLSDPSKGIINSLKMTLKELEVPFSENDDFSWVIGPTLDSAFVKILNTKDESVIQKAVGIFRSHYADGGLYENELYDEVKDLLVSLKENDVSLFVATSKPQWFAEPILKEFGIDGFFTEVCGSLKDSRKDKGSIISHLIKENDIKAEESLMVGDRKYDILGAKEHGMKSVGVDFGFAQEGELEAVGPDYMISGMKDLKSIVLSNHSQA